MKNGNFAFVLTLTPPTGGINNRLTAYGLPVAEIY